MLKSDVAKTLCIRTQLVFVCANTDIIQSIYSIYFAYAIDECELEVFVIQTVFCNRRGDQ